MTEKKVKIFAVKLLVVDVDLRLIFGHALSLSNYK